MVMPCSYWLSRYDRISDLVHVGNILVSSRAGKPRPSWIILGWGTFDRFVEVMVMPGIERGELSADDLIDVVAALRLWEET
jgi:hypothetical protein